MHSRKTFGRNEEYFPEYFILSNSEPYNNLRYLNEVSYSGDKVYIIKSIERYIDQENKIEYGFVISALSETTNGPNNFLILNRIEHNYRAAEDEIHK